LSKRLLYMLFISLVALGAPSWGQGVQTIQTQHFRIHFLPGSDGTARKVAEVAEEVFPPMAAAYNYLDEFSEPIHVIILDTSDRLGNAFADYYGNRIVLWSTNLDTELRGTHDYVKNVFTHELAHILTLNTARKKWPFQFALFSVSRFDANPDITFSFPLFNLNTPSWWTEGVAQYADDRLGFEEWDTHRDMLLRMAALEDDLISYEEMGSFLPQGRFYAEMSYNQGYALLLYIRDQYGPGKVEQLTHHIGGMSFDPAVRRVLGISADELYADWKRHLRDSYAQIDSEIRAAGYFEGALLKELNEGVIEYHPSFSPDGKKLAYISSRKRDFAIPELIVYDFERGKKKVLKGYVDTRIAWAPDGESLLFVRNLNGFNDLFVYDLVTDKERRISARLRAKDPSFSPDGTRIVFVHNADGTNNLGLINADGTGKAFLTNNNDMTQYYGPRFSPDGQHILFGIFRGEDRDIALISADSPPRDKDYGLRDRKAVVVPDSLKVFPDSLAFPHPDTSGFKALLASGADERDPYWLPDGSGFLFASDRSGIFNIYQYDMASGRVDQLTNVVGGAFAPAISSQGKVVYAGYHAQDFNLYEFELEDAGMRQSAAFSPVPGRDFQSVIDFPKISEEFTVGRYSGRNILSYIPILQVGPSFVGNSFGLNALSGGMQFSSGEMLGGSEFTGWGILGKNVRDDTDFNTDFGFFYQRNLFPLSGNSRRFNPSFFAGFRRREVDNLIKSSTEVQRDTLAPSAVIGQLDSAGTELVLIPDAQQYVIQVSSREDLFKSVFKNWSLGVELPLSAGQRLSASYSRRDYDENWTVRSLRNDGRLFLVQNGIDVTGALPTDQTTLQDIVVDTQDPATQYDGLSFYSSHDLALSWGYQRFQPTADGGLNPIGRSVGLLVRYSMPTLADSLAQVFPAEGQAPGDPLQGVDRSFRVNEYVASYYENIALPYRNSLSLRLIGAYRNISLKQPFDADGGIFEGRFYWPMRYYLGGLNFLSGYPYFSVWGSKVAYGRVGYSFPVARRLSMGFLNFTFSKLYAEVFAETGAVSNRDNLDLKDFDTDKFLSDVGGELRLELFTFYRLRMRAFFQVAHPLDRGKAPRNGDGSKIDRWRYYFGFGL
jgi:hypothetical protein